MKRCLNPICRLLNNDSAKVCKSCKATNFLQVEEQVPSVSVSNLGLLDTQGVQALPPTDVVAVAPVDQHDNGGSTINAPSEDPEPPEVTPSNHSEAAVSQVWPWVK